MRLLRYDDERQPVNIILLIIGLFVLFINYMCDYKYNNGALVSLFILASCVHINYAVHFKEKDKKQFILNIISAIMFLGIAVYVYIKKLG